MAVDESRYNRSKGEGMMNDLMYFIAGIMTGYLTIVLIAWLDSKESE